MNVEVELMDPEFNPDSSEVFNQSEELDDLESQDEDNEASDSNEVLDESEDGSAVDVYEGFEETSEYEELIEESLVYDDTVLIERLDVLHNDFLMIFTVLIVMFARICFSSLSNLAGKSHKAIRR